MAQIKEGEKKGGGEGNTQAAPDSSGGSDGKSKEKAKASAVSFAPDTKPPSVRRSRAAATNSGPPRSPKRTYLGKADLKRDGPVFFFLMAFLAWIAYITGDIGRPKHKVKRSGIGALNDELEKLAKVLVKNRADERRVTRKIGSDCSLFLGSSSINRAGLSWFAGRAYQQDEVVLDATATHSLGVSSIPQVAFQLKHHPYMSNIKLEGSAYKATRYIDPGEEFFLLYNQHPHATNNETSVIFDMLPTPQDFGYASRIVALETQFQPPAPKTKTSRTTVPKRIKPKEKIVTKADSLVMMKQAIAMLNPRIAGLLPHYSKNLYELNEKEGPFEYAVLRNRTAQWLEIHGHCMDLVSKKDGKIVAQQKILQGDTLLVVPLYIRTQPSCGDETQGDTCSTPKYPCLTHDQSILLLCPLGAAASSLTYSSTESNTKYNWGLWNELNFEANRRNSADEILHHHSNSMSLDVVATQDIEAGEEIVVAAAAHNQLGVHALDGIFRLEWMEK